MPKIMPKSMPKSMPKILIFNTEEVGPSFCNHTAARAANRYLWLLEEGDIAITPTPPNEAHWNYVQSIIPGMTYPLSPSSPVSAGGLIHRIVADQALIEHLRKIITKKQKLDIQFQLCTYFPSPEILQLSKILDIPLHPLMPSTEFLQAGLSLKFNSKSYITQLAPKLNIPVVPGVVVNNKQQLTAAINNYGNNSAVMIKKTLSAGGYGNHAGTPSQLQPLIEEMPSQIEEMIVGPLLPFTKTIGSLAEIGSEQIKFLGMDLQIIKQYGWCGLQYPYPFPLDIQKKIKNWTMILAEHLQSLGGRGYLNLDFGVIENAEKDTGETASILLLESNFRYNGFSLMLRILELIHGHTLPHAHLYYSANWRPSTDQLQTLFPHGNYEQQGIFQLDGTGQYVCFSKVPRVLVDEK
ncbi:MAG: hypothetical protein HQK53_07370 [Oligoflexia bacterium]|nr:hypothetical protein [Oligoflexia bacterium]